MRDYLARCHQTTGPEKLALFGADPFNNANSGGCLHPPSAAGRRCRTSDLPPPTTANFKVHACTSAGLPGRKCIGHHYFVPERLRFHLDSASSLYFLSNTHMPKLFIWIRPSVTSSSPRFRLTLTHIPFYSPSNSSTLFFFFFFCQLPFSL